MDNINPVTHVITIEVREPDGKQWFRVFRGEANRNVFKELVCSTDSVDDTLANVRTALAPDNAR